jgi:hypothetical protein
MNSDTLINFSFFDNKTDNTPKMRRLPWGEVVALLSTHTRRASKDGALFSPAVYAANAHRNNDEVIGLGAAVADYDSGVDWGSIQERLRRAFDRVLRAAARGEENGEADAIDEQEAHDG